MDQDEDTRLFLSTLDASTERIFEGRFVEIMAAEFSAISVASDTETDHQSTSNRLQQDDKLLPQLNAFPSESQESSYYCTQPRKRRKRSWTTDQDVLEEPSSAKQINLSATENTCAFVGWPQTFAFSSYEPGQPLIEFKAKNNFTFAKNFKQHQRKGALRRNIGSTVNNLLGDAMLPPKAGIDGKWETKNTEKVDNFAKGMQYAIDIFQSQIPSYEEKLANGFETPINQQNAGKLELRVRLHNVNLCSRRKSTNGASKSKITLHNQLSEEASWSSPSTSSGTSVRQSGYPSSLTASNQSTDIYSDGGDDTASEYGKVRQSSGKWSESSQTNTDYYTFSDSSSQDRYYLSPSSQESSESSPRWEDHRVEKGKTVGKMSKFRKKLGTIFHHHHHHHHHYNDRDESDLTQVGLFKRFGKLLHRSGKNDRKRVKADKPQKPGNKSVVKKKQDAGHFRTLVDGLMHHMRHSKKPKKVKADTEILGSGPHKSKRTKKKLPQLPKMGRGKVKAPNKGNVKLKRIATKTAKMILT